MDQDIGNAIAAYEAGDAAACVRLLLPDLGVTEDPRLLLLLGEACRMTGDDQTLLKAADRLLNVDPNALRALIWKGDIYARAHDTRRAMQYYTTALEQSARFQLPPTLRLELERVASKRARLHQQLYAYLDQYLTQHGLPQEKRSSRLVQSLQILSGAVQAEMALQRPTQQYLPGLPQQAWYDAQAYDWVQGVEAQTDAIREELLSVLQDDAAFKPYIEGDTHGPARNYQGLLNNPAWSAFYLWRDGQPVAENIARCPVTAAVLATVPQPMFPGRAPTAMFSLLKPQTHIPPHHGMLNTRLIAHLPLIVPEGCAMRVGDETRAWQTGKLALFDDSVEHEAWNNSNQTRVVLLFDVARPELDATELKAVALCFAAMDGFAGLPG
jgi:aspartate beta-hydroxylase